MALGLPRFPRCFAGAGAEARRACGSRPRPGAAFHPVSVMGAGLALPRREPDAPSPSGGGVTGPPDLPIGAHSSACTLGDEYRDVDSFILDVLGFGAMGKVRLLRHKRTGLHFAQGGGEGYDAPRDSRGEARHRGEGRPLGARAVAPRSRRQDVRPLSGRDVAVHPPRCVPGGELRSKMRRHGRFSEEVTRFFVAAVATAIDHLASSSARARISNRRTCCWTTGGTPSCATSARAHVFCPCDPKRRGLRARDGRDRRRWAPQVPRAE